MKYWRGYKKYGTTQPHPVDMMFDYFEKQKITNQESDKNKIKNIPLSKTT